MKNKHDLVFGIAIIITVIFVVWFLVWGTFKLREFEFVSKTEQKTDILLNDSNIENDSNLTKYQKLAIKHVKEIVYIYDAEVDVCYAVVLGGSLYSERIIEVPYEKFKKVAIIISKKSDIK